MRVVRLSGRQHGAGAVPGAVRHAAGADADAVFAATSADRHADRSGHTAPTRPAVCDQLHQFRQHSELPDLLSCAALRTVCHPDQRT